MKELINNIILENIPDANCYFEGDSCNLKFIVSSAEFKGMSLLDQHKKVMKSYFLNFGNSKLSQL